LPWILQLRKLFFLQYSDKISRLLHWCALRYCMTVKHVQIDSCRDATSFEWRHAASWICILASLSINYEAYKYKFVNFD
jgi:hypothetical protein